MDENRSSGTARNVAGKVEKGPRTGRKSVTWKRRDLLMRCRMLSCWSSSAAPCRRQPGGKQSLK
jgi:hypothetical protein